MSDQSESSRLKKLMKKLPMLFEYQARAGTISEHLNWSRPNRSGKQKAKMDIKVNVNKPKI